MQSLLFLIKTPNLSTPQTKTQPTKNKNRYLMPSVQAYGGPSWLWSCLLPPSALSLFAHVLTKLEGGGKVGPYSPWMNARVPPTHTRIMYIASP